MSPRPENGCDLYRPQKAPRGTGQVTPRRVELCRNTGDMQEPYFEGRAVKLHGEYVRSTDLVVGQVYFKLGFLDEDMAVPDMYPLVFIGRDLHSKLPGFYFQDASSYLDGVRWTDDVVPSDLDEDLPDGYTWEGDEVQFEWEKGKSYSGVFDFEGALNSLLGCSLRRRQWDGVIRRVPPDPSEP
jgi:hypothetical protein